MKRRFSGYMALPLLLFLALVMFIGRGRTSSDNHADEKNASQTHKKMTLPSPKTAAEKSAAGNTKRTKPYPYTLRSGYEIMPDAGGLPKISLSKVPKHISEAMGYGATGKVTLRVVDSTGTPVPDAHVEAAFFNNDEPEHIVEARSDCDGLVPLEEKCVGDLNFYVSKDGYYKTTMRYWFLITGYDCVKDGRWQPWNPVVEVVLKEKRKPVPMYIKHAKLSLPEKGIPFGFDCEVGEMVKPYGAGKRADLVFLYSLAISDADEWCYTNRLTIAAPMGGIKSLCIDKWSALHSAYEVPVGELGDSIIFYVESTGRGNKRAGVNFTDDIYLCFQTRKAEGGGAGDANCGKICPDSFYYGESGDGGTGGQVDFTYYYNPVRGDNSLEFDGKNNLFKQDWRDTPWPKEP